MKGEGKEEKGGSIIEGGKENAVPVLSDIHENIMHVLCAGQREREV